MSMRRAPVPVYLWLAGGSAACYWLVFTLNLVYQVKVIGLSPLQLVLVGTVLEASVFIGEVPTGIVADIYSRRLSILIGLVLIGAGLALGAVPSFATVLVAQVLWGVGYTFTSGAQQAWLTDEIGTERIAAVFVRSTQAEMVGMIVGIVLAGALGLVWIGLPIETRPSAPASTMPTIIPTISACVDRTNTAAIRSVPISSVSQACCAPLVNVYPTPHSTCATSTVAKLGTAPRARPAPIRTSPMRIDNRQLQWAQPDHLHLVDEVQREHEPVARRRPTGQPEIHRHRCPTHAHRTRMKRTGAGVTRDPRARPRRVSVRRSRGSVCCT